MKNRFIPLVNFAWKRQQKNRSKTEEVFEFSYVSKVYIQKELKSLKRSKATGFDDLAPNLIKDSAEMISKPMAFIVNLFFKTGVMPTEWKIALIKPLHKSGEGANPDNYRPISILPVLSKIMEKAVHNQLSEYLESNNLLSEKQFGYRKKRSTELAKALLLDDIRKAADKGKITGAIFIDLSKAFDTLGHATLLAKLKQYGVSNVTLQWFESYLFDRKQIVGFDDELSDPYPVLCGVPQGSILGPLLFLILFNDFPDILKKADVVEFADDTVIYVSSNKISQIEEMLNNDLKNISSYFRENELVINLKPGKTECVLFGTAKRLAMSKADFALLFDGVPINVTTSYKYLGTVIDHTLYFGPQFDSMYKKSSSKLRLLCKLKYFLNEEAIRHVYRSIIQSVIRYNYF